MPEELSLSAYYYSFNPTGCEPVDRILAAVAEAGKAYHHTENWSDEEIYDGKTCVSIIQDAANAAAEAWKRRS